MNLVLHGRVRNWLQGLIQDEANLNRKRNRRQTMYLDSKTTEGDRIRNELFRFVSEDVIGFDSARALPELQHLMKTRTEVTELMAAAGWRLIQTAKASAADLVGMDFIFINFADDRYFFIDITLDTKCKSGLPYLRAESVFLVSVNEDERVDVESKQRFLELLFDLMTTESVLSVQETPPPNYTSKLSFLEIAQQLENFRKQLDARVAYLQREIVLEEASAALSREAEIVHEYSVHLARAMAYARGEHERSSDLSYKVKIEHFSGVARNALFTAVRDYLGLDKGQGKLGDTQKTHTAVYDKRLDELNLMVGGQAWFKLYRVSALVDSVVAHVCGKASANGADFFQLKRQLGTDQGRVQVIAAAITIIHSTKIQSLLGPTHVVPQTKTALRKQKKKGALKDDATKAA
jgi:hypothetical protein